LGGGCVFLLLLLRKCECRGSGQYTAEHDHRRALPQHLQQSREI
jgi:hypothetical protein